MPLTPLDPRTALVVIDLQQGIVGLAKAHSADQVVERSAQLAQAFRQKGLPVSWVNVIGRAKGKTDAEQPDLSALPAIWFELVPELNIQPGEHKISKQCWGAFTGTPLHSLLQQLKVTQIVLAGISTSAGIESTARNGYELGYSITFASDAMTERDPAAHAHTLEKIFPRIGQVTDTQSLLDQLK
jgi:nicotinamidase-related amidase